MANRTVRFAGDAILNELRGLLLYDNGDGTYSIGVSGGISSSVGIVSQGDAGVQAWLVSEASGTGHYDVPAHTAVNITVSTGVALASNTARRYACFINDSDAVIYLALGTAAALHLGIRLEANGGRYEMSAKLGNLYTGAVNAIHGSTGNKALLVTEGSLLT
jgi:hypothetical protein